jgi:hypothetical protein
MWRRANPTKVTCPFCRSEWEDPVDSKSKVAKVVGVSMPDSRNQTGYYNVRDQLSYD